jgi:hypothetical protein
MNYLILNRQIDSPGRAHSKYIIYFIKYVVVVEKLTEIFRSRDF